METVDPSELIGMRLAKAWADADIAEDGAMADGTCGDVNDAIGRTNDAREAYIAWTKGNRD